MFSSGVICLRLLPWIPPTSQAWAVFIVLIIASIGLLRRIRVGMRQLIWFAIGLSWATGYASQTVHDRLPAALEKRDLQLVGRVDGTIERTAHGGRFDFRVLQSLADGVEVEVPSKVRLSAFDDKLLPTGQGVWRLTARLKRPWGIVNPDAPFIYESWLFQSQIGATGYIIDSAPEAAVQAGIAGRVSAAIDKLRGEFSQFLGANTTPRNSAILSALGVGIRDGLSATDWSLLQATGTVHLVAISGLHIGFVALIAGWATGMLWRVASVPCRWIPAPIIAVLGAVLAGSAYAMIAGFTLPTRRALVMLLLAAMAILLRRRVVPARLLATALALVLAFDPLAPLGSSFWLSFVAVAVLIFLGMDTQRRLSKVTKPARKTTILAREWLGAQVWLLVGMAPILLVAFQKLSLVSPLANLVAVPLIGMLVVPLCLFSLVSWSLGFVAMARWLTQVGSWLLELVWEMLTVLANPTWAAIELASPHPAALLAAALGFLLLSLGRALPARHLGYLMLLPLFVTRPGVLSDGEFQAVVLDTGQGLSVVIRTKNHVLVYDVGAAYPGGFDLGEAAVLPHLRQVGLRHVDTLIVSHGDIDHIGGAKSLSRGLPITRFFSSAPGSERAPNGGSHCHWDQTWHWDGVDFRMLWPPPGMPYRGNDSSCVLRVSSEYGSILLPGDIEAGVERDLLARYGAKLAAKALVVPHHGSKTSSSPNFLLKVKPEIAVVSSGYLNRFRHPHDNVVKRYERLEIPLLNTAYEGAVSLDFLADKLLLSGARSSRRRFWLAPGSADIDGINLRINDHGNEVLESAASINGYTDP